MLKKALRSACAIALLTCLMGASGSAQTYDKRTVFTFNGPSRCLASRSRPVSTSSDLPIRPAAGRW